MKHKTKSAVLLSILISITGSTATAIADDTVKVTIDSLTNADNRAMEACGTAIHPNGATPLMVTVHHGQASYTTLVSKKGKWCVLMKRWNYSGAIEAEGDVLN